LTVFRISSKVFFIMIDNFQKQRLHEKLFESQCSIVTHQAYLARIDSVLRTIEILAICAPIGFMSVQLSLISNVAITKILSIINPILSAALLILAVFSLTQSYRQRLQDHQKFLVENFPIAEQLRALLIKTEADDRDVEKIMDKITALDKEEARLMAHQKADEKQTFYREAMKRMGDIDVKCPKCGKSPWEYQKSKNKCQVCGSELPLP